MTPTTRPAVRVASATPPPPITRLLTKKKVPFRLRFQPRHVGGRQLLLIRIGVNGQQDSGFSTLPTGEVLELLPADRWDQKQQRRTDRDAYAFNTELHSIRLALTGIYNRQVAEGLTPTCQSVKLDYFGRLRHRPVAPTVLDCYEEYLDELPAHLAETTRQKWHYGLNYLLRYVDGQPVPVEGVTVGWAKRYHAWLMHTGPMTADSATRYVLRLSEALTGWVERDQLARNPLAGVKFGRAKTKEVVFLEAPHLTRYWALTVEEPLKTGAWWLGVMMYTGLDYADAVRYVADPTHYHRPVAGGEKIVIRRNKGGAECHIPILPELRGLLLQAPTGKVPTCEQINEQLKRLEGRLGFEHRLTTKVARKTAGALFLLRGYRIEAVSRILGHASVAVTERYYVKITGALVDAEIQRLEAN